jgi:hypothetical protein
MSANTKEVIRAKNRMLLPLADQLVAINQTIATLSMAIIRARRLTLAGLFLPNAR